MALIHDHAVVLVHGGAVLAAVIGSKTAPNHGLDGRQVNFGRHIRVEVAQALDLVDVGEGLQALHLHVFEGVVGLLAQ